MKHPTLTLTGASEKRGPFLDSSDALVLGSILAATCLDSCPPHFRALEPRDDAGEKTWF